MKCFDIILSAKFDLAHTNNELTKVCQLFLTS